jgi:hypothetical protein
VIAKVRGELSVRKKAAQNDDVERFYLNELSELAVRKQYQIEISSSFAALKKLNDSACLNNAWEKIERMSKSQLKRQ